eukprot:6032575-Alexandrium_andersonii.AAC.1
MLDLRCSQHHLLDGLHQAPELLEELHAGREGLEGRAHARDHLQGPARAEALSEVEAALLLQGRQVLQRSLHALLHLHGRLRAVHDLCEGGLELVDRRLLAQLLLHSHGAERVQKALRVELLAGAVAAPERGLCNLHQRPLVLRGVGKIVDLLELLKEDLEVVLRRRRATPQRAQVTARANS